MSHRLTLVVALVLSSAAIPVVAQEACLPFENGDGHSPVITARVNGQGPFEFVLDTASSATTLDASTITRLALTPDAASEQAQGMGGEFSVRLFQVAEINTGPISLYEVTVPEVPAPTLDSHEIVGLGGIDLLAGRLTVWRPSASCVGIVPSGQLPGGEGWVEISVDWIQPWKVMLPVQIDGVSGWALLDTGAQKTVMNQPFAEALDLTASSGRVREGGQITGLDGRPLPLFEAEVVKAAIGPWTWSMASVNIGDLPVFSRLGDPTRPLMILGMDWLAGRPFAVDYGTQKVWLGTERQHPLAHPDADPAEVR
ncbi:retroviral-like aspartic protease family protein [Brevundimonas sp.]|uniref:retroviral-like aspartic protease family protein n=1 Tax=Brevundimonas sp. TaxID=1871086 RepID=UPI001E1AC659|nr:retroviral-like aspartic protease family protein [Brevundimonas sp.]MBA4001501.1 hypothetical protein [Brevundimonas sp.]